MSRRPIAPGPPRADDAAGRGLRASATPLVSVLLPARDAQATLAACLASLARQTETRWECVVVDDASRDATGALATRFGQQDPRVRVVTGRGRGLVAALQLGLAHCRAPLIARMDVETGRLGSDVHAALVGITALDLGRRSEAWQRWWAGEGATFQVPGEREAQRALDERAAKKDRGGTTAQPEDFYEIQVESERVVFVLDTSGSMRKPVQTVGRIERSRMDVAKEQLTQVVRSMPEGTLFNVVFFEETVKALSRKTLEMNRSNRQKALRFVRDQYAIGGTALYPALELAFQDPLVDTVYLLSDGAPTVGELTDIEEIRAEVARWNAARHVKVHGVSMGQDSTLLQWLCQDTGGTYKRVD